MPETSFDLTNFGKKTRFQKVLDAFDLTEYERYEYDGRYAYVWYNPDTGDVIKTSNNPISGKYSSPDRRRDEVGYASYMALYSPDRTRLHEMIDAVENHAIHIKDGPADGFSNVPMPFKYLTRHPFEDPPERIGFVFERRSVESETITYSYDFEQDGEKYLANIRLNIENMDDELSVVMNYEKKEEGFWNHKDTLHSTGPKDVVDALKKAEQYAMEFDKSGVK